MLRLLRAFLSIFLDVRYLQGRYFERSLGGYVWALRTVWQRNILRLAPVNPFPIGLGCQVSNPQHLFFHPDDLNNFQTGGTYFQNISGKIHIGRGTYIAPNVGIITSNHDVADLNRHAAAQDVVLGERCWIGMNAVILPGVVLGPGTVVGAGAVVAHSFPEGACLLVGVPAVCKKLLQPTHD